MTIYYLCNNFNYMEVLQGTLLVYEYTIIIRILL
jgi:hypothetical protein